MASIYIDAGLEILELGSDGDPVFPIDTDVLFDNTITNPLHQFNQYLRFHYTPRAIWALSYQGHIRQLKTEAAIVEHLGSNTMVSTSINSSYCTGLKPIDDVESGDQPQHSSIFMVFLRFSCRIPVH